MLSAVSCLCGVLDNRSLQFVLALLMSILDMVLTPSTFVLSAVMHELQLPVLVSSSSESTDLEPWLLGADPGDLGFAWHSFQAFIPVCRSCQITLSQHAPCDWHALAGQSCQHQTLLSLCCTCLPVCVGQIHEWQWHVGKVSAMV